MPAILREGLNPFLDIAVLEVVPHRSIHSALLPVTPGSTVPAIRGKVASKVGRKRTAAPIIDIRTTSTIG
jgi:hypothetical protein